MQVEILDQPFDPWQKVLDYQATQSQMRGKFGATACFVGTMRDFNEGKDIVAMHLEHYPGMTEGHLETIVAEAIGHHGLLDALVVHRIGDLHPEDPIVLVAVWSAHRAAAFEACRAIMEALKSHAPFWKREQHADGQGHWVVKNTPG